jgi:phosphatidylserine/phosphatidylglycerophosphate/cardiolipin synthase-like enzyme
MIEFVKNRGIYEKLIMDWIPGAASFVWIATADIKDLHVESRGGYRPFLGVLSDLVEDGVDVRLLHAKEPGPRFREDFDRYPSLVSKLERVLCPRVHLKTVIIDGRSAYLGSANLTGAGMGAKSKDRRNFESGILSDDPSIVTPVMEQFDEIWMGSCCDTCQRRKYCNDPIV